ncbi:MAG: NAD(+) synthase [Desulfobacterota bacterium]|nr:NAD(+) synthase [Thermodesulfobacteriota bacterium]
MKTDHVIEYLVTWLRTYCDDALMQGFVVGVSGGIDSAVTSTLCARTGKKVILLNMPIRQAQDQFNRAAHHIAWLSENYPQTSGMTIDLTQPFEAIERTLPRDIQDGLTMANTRARLRMLTLYAVASHFRLLVVGTGNKVEDYGIGFFTKYGDGGGDIAPIADLMKTEVYEIARSLGISAAILEAPPTDGLWEDNRSDESQIGATYPELEWAMRYEEGLEKPAVLTPRQQQVLAIFRRFREANRHKMMPIPCARIPDHLR